MQLRDLLVLGLQAEQHPRTLGLVLFLHRTDQRVRRCGGGGVRRFGGAIVGRSCCGGPLWWNRSCGPIGRKWCRGRPLSGRWTHVWHRTRLIARRSLVHSHWPLLPVRRELQDGGHFQRTTGYKQTSRGNSRIPLVARVRERWVRGQTARRRSAHLHPVPPRLYFRSARLQDARGASRPALTARSRHSCVIRRLACLPDPQLMRWPPRSPLCTHCCLSCSSKRLLAQQQQVLRGWK